MAEITRRKTMLEALEYFRGIKKLTSKDHNGLEPAEGEEEEFATYSAHCQNMQELIQAHESEPVRAAIANWQAEVMEHGPSQLKLDGEEAVLTLKEEAEA